MLNRGGGSRKPASQLSAGASDRGSDVDCSLLPSDISFAGCLGQLARLAYALFLRRGAAHWRTLAGLVDDHRRDDHQCLVVKCDGAYFHPHAVRDGGRWLSSSRAHPQASALRDAVDCDRRLWRDLRLTCRPLVAAADYDLQLAACGNYDHDRTCCMATSPH